MVRLTPIRLGDRKRTAEGWLVICDGALRAIASRDEDGAVLYGFSCDARIRPLDGFMRFRDRPEFEAWLRKRLTPARSRSTTAHADAVASEEIAAGSSPSV